MENIETILRYASEKRILIEKNAIELIIKKTNWREILEALEKKGKFLVTTEDIKEIEKELVVSEDEEEKKGLKEGVRKEIEVLGKRVRGEAQEVAANFKILDEFNVTSKSSLEGTVEDFLHYFQDKFTSLEKIIKMHPNFTPKPIKRLRTVPKNAEVDFIGMVSRKWVTKNGHTAFELEDLEKKCIVLILKEDRELEREKELILLDNVIGVRGIKISEEMVIAKQIVWPDIPLRNEKHAERELYIAGISDLHVGSKLFLQNTFEKFLQWIKGNIGSERDKQEVGKIKYLVVSGDNVDGVGVYPAQYGELAIKDIFKQYELFSELILQIPEHIEIFIIPGQHDAVRWADPQPPIGKEFVPDLYNAKNVHLLSSPSWVEIEGLKTMIYHGASLHDFFSQVSFLNAMHPEKGMLEIMKKRDLMCTYGFGRPYVPEKKDFMLIRTEPDLVFLGDHHRVGYASYHGTTIINNATFQAETAYQIEQGHVPTPGIVPIINLKTRAIIEKQFIQEKGVEK